MSRASSTYTMIGRFYEYNYNVSTKKVRQNSSLKMSLFMT